MKRIKKLASLVLALAMALTLAVPVLAADADEDEEKYDITIGSSEDGSAVTGHTYNVYQIFTGDIAIDNKNTADTKDDTTILSNIAYGQNYKGVEGKSLDDLLTDLEKMSGAEAAAFLNAGITGDPIDILNGGENGYTAKDLAAGYYLIVDVSTGLPAGQTTSAFILKLVKDITVNSKHTSGPVVEKKVDDKNDSNHDEDEIDWQDSADHDIGDMIDFKISATIPAAFTQFKENNKAYPFTFHDTEEAGLSFQSDSVKVYVVNGTTETLINEGYEVVYPATDGHTFDVKFTNLTTISDVQAGSKIVVKYKSQLNSNAVIGSQGNVNKVFGEYRNYYDTEKPNYTPEDTVIVFTYKVIVNKVDEDLEPLSGATFKLEKKLADGTTKEIAIVETTPDTTFTFEGLDDGEYILTETATPPGYNSIAPITFTVTAGHDILADNPSLQTLSGDKVTGEVEIGFTPDKSAGSLTTAVKNQSGATLPETGGMGTTLFYALGAVLVIGAGVAMVTKKRMA